MDLTSKNLFLLCQCAISAACQAGSLIQKYTGRKIAIKNKQNAPSLATQVVTEVDFKSQELILNTLLPTCKYFDLALLTEEATDDKSRFDKDFYWCIDPIDGTLPFTESKPGYAVSIALVNKFGVPYIGVVFDPYHGDLYYAVKNKGVYKNGFKLDTCIRKKDDNKTLSVFFDRSFFSGNLFAITEIELKELTNKYKFADYSIQQAGGSVISALQVIEQSPACYFKYPREEDSGGSLWDYAATSCIFNELKLPVSDIFGEEMELNREGSTFMNHKGFIYASENYIAKEVKELYKRIIENRV